MYFTQNITLVESIKLMVHPVLLKAAARKKKELHKTPDFVNTENVRDICFIISSTLLMETNYVPQILIGGSIGQLVAP